VDDQTCCDLSKTCVHRRTDKLRKLVEEWSTQIGRKAAMTNGCCDMSTCLRGRRRVHRLRRKRRKRALQRLQPCSRRAVRHGREKDGLWSDNDGESGCVTMEGRRSGCLCAITATCYEPWRQGRGSQCATRGNLTCRTSPLRPVDPAAPGRLGSAPCSTVLGSSKTS
jgi:hypothetical protein